jgi:head-tail adaptor
MIPRLRVRTCDLRYRVDLLTLAEAAVAGTGGLSETFTTLATVWARVLPIAPGRYNSERQVDGGPTTEFVIRWREDWRDVKWIDHDGGRYRVAGQAEIEPRRFVQLLAEEQQRL